MISRSLALPFDVDEELAREPELERWLIASRGGNLVKFSVTMSLDEREREREIFTIEARGREMIFKGNDRYDRARETPSIIFKIAD